MIGVPVTNLYLCLVFIETKLLKLNPDLFGKMLKSHNHESYKDYTTRMKQNSSVSKINKDGKIKKKGRKSQSKQLNGLKCMQQRLC